MNPAGLGHRQQFNRGEAAFRSTHKQGFHRNAGDAPSFLAIRIVGTCVQVTTFWVPPGSFGGGLRWG